MVAKIKVKAKSITLDEALTPMKMQCIKCGGEMTVYPRPDVKGTGYCPCTSPAWLKSFALFCTNEERIKHGLKPIEETK
jgi:hypothetical protein